MGLREEAVQKALANREQAEKAASEVSERSQGSTEPAKNPVGRCIGFLLLLPVCSFGGVTAIFIHSYIGGAAISLALLAGFYVLFRKKLTPAVAATNGIVAGILILALTVLMIVAKGNTDSRLMTAAGERICLFLFPGYGLMTMMSMERLLRLFLPVAAVLLAFLLSVLLQKDRRLLKKSLPFLAVMAVCVGTMAVLAARRPAQRYAGHGFEYMHGWSSTDFSDYMVWSDPSKLAALDHPAGLIIEDEKDMPVLDGAEACFPLYSSVAKAVYKDIATIEERYQRGEGLEHDWKKWEYISENGKIVRFTNTVNAFERLLEKKVDVFFGARPSKNQQEMAKEKNVPITVTPIGKEAFVFFVEPDNPVRDLTSDQLRAIYHGDIANWKEVGGKNQKITAFQRPENSGSQAMMAWFMGDVSLKDPESYEYVEAMGAVVRKVSQYANEAGALGYSFRYFVEDLQQEDDVRLLAVDGVLPTLENINNGSYPLTVDLCVITRENDPNPYVQKMVDFMLSEDGQELVEKSGYGVLK